MKKYITRAGFEKLREELRRLLYDDRPRVTQEVTVAAAHGDRSENYEYKLGKKKLREIDARIYRLQKQLESYEVVDPATRPKTDRVFFGATVTVEDEDGGRTTYQIVGGEELDDGLGPGRISYEAPLGRALLGRRKGDSVTVRRPAGEVELTIVKVEWK
ncbi:MAG: transcription elongation factor GreB [Deltaproteobacteria bacterium]|nr:MAG: transcription elongation factor GreB [Deltaproteobacteria bacterium]TMA76222.1 MAG: transcription elongation factor GreB [Deltaproteobacteria bacterium]TMB39839.1 MAG: transcription elongation factor GreB [Deltaproteobacteria bacterium]